MTLRIIQNFPIWTVDKPAAAACDVNGRLTSSRLTQIGLGGRLEATQAAPAWSALYIGAAAEGFTGDDALTWTPGGTYRDLEAQERGFYQRFRPVAAPDSDMLPDRFYAGSWWELLPGMAPVSTPGGSKHGDALAVDTALGPNQNAARYIGAATPHLPYSSALAWLLTPAPLEWQHDLDREGATNAESFGFCWEPPAKTGLAVEPWHLNYYRGERRTARTAAVLAFVGAS